MFKGKKSFIGTTLLSLVAVVYCLVEAEGNGDFFIFISASSWLNGHSSIYEYKYQGDYHYYYSVLFALVLKPFYYLPFFWVKFSWLMFNLFLYYRLFVLLIKAPFVQALKSRQRTIFLSGVFLFSFRFLHDNIHASQITILILFCAVYGVYFVETGKILPGSLLLAIGINIKLLPIVLLPYLLYKGYFKAFLLTVSFYLLSLLAPALVIGLNYNLYQLQSWFQLINPTNTHHVLDVDERSFHGLTTLLSTLCVEKVPDYLALDIKRNICNVSLETLAKIILVARLSLVAFTLYFLGLKPFNKSAPPANTLATVSYILLLVPLIFPHQQHYGFLFICPAFAFTLYTLVAHYHQLRKPIRFTLISLISLVYLASNAKILLGEFNQYYEHFKILTYAALLLIPLLAWACYYTGRRLFKA